MNEVAETAREILVVELSAGQMIEDVRLATNCRRPISFFGRMGGIVPLPEDIYAEITKLV
jgi:2-oxoglutarate ferredoxin oxidoreductase subunit alpha